MWIKDRKLFHSFYQKPTKTPYVLMARSAMATQQKFQILCNELIRMWRIERVDGEEEKEKEAKDRVLSPSKDNSEGEGKEEVDGERVLVQKEA